MFLLDNLLNFEVKVHCDLTSVPYGLHSLYTNHVYFAQASNRCKLIHHSLAEALNRKSVILVLNLIDM